MSKTCCYGRHVLYIFISYSSVVVGVIKKVFVVISLGFGLLVKLGCSTILQFYIIEQKVIPLFMMSSMRIDASRLEEVVGGGPGSSVFEAVAVIIMARRLSYSSRYFS